MRTPPEMELAQPDSLLHESVENLSDVGYLMDLEGRLTYVSPALERILGIVPADFIGRSVFDLISAEDQSKAREAFRDIARGRSEPHEYRVRLAPEGPERWVKVWSRLMIGDGRPVGFAGMLTDVTEARRAQEALARSEERFRRITESVTDYIYSVKIENGQAVATRHGPGCEVVTGYTSEDFDADPNLWISMIVACDRTRIEDQAHRLTRGEERPPIEHRIVRKDGVVRWVRNTPVLQCDAQGRPVGYDGLIHDITASKSSEEALRASEAALKRSQAVAHVGHWVWDKERDSVEWSDEMYRIFGIAPSQSGERPDLNAIAARAIHPDDLQRVAEVSRRTREEGQPGEMEYRVIWPDGSIRHVWALSADIVRNEHGAIIQVSGIVQDITERKQAEHSLFEKSREIETFFDNALDLLCIIDSEGIFRRVNREWENLLGYTTQELEGRRLVDFVHPDDQPATIEATEISARRPVTSFINRYRAHGGLYHWIEWRSIPYGKLIYAAARDVTERKRAEEALRVSEEKFYKAFRNAPVWVSIATLKEGVYIDVNNEAMRISGFTREEMIGHSSTEIGWISPANRQRLLAALDADGHVSGLELSFTAKDGRTVYGLVHGETITVDNRPCLLTATVDITDRLLAEAERIDLERRLLHTQKLESLGVMAGGIAHDFNNLLMGILGNLDLALQDLKEGAPALRMIAQAVKATRRATDLTRQMLAYSGKGSFEVRRVELNNLVQDNVGLLQGVIAGKTALEVDLSASEPAILADPGQVQQVIMNLITNAAEAVGDLAGGIMLRTGVTDCTDDDLARSRLSQKPPAGRYAFVEVNDTGSGMDESTLERLFDPFFTTKFTGRGLGMSAVLGIMRSHKGAIFVESAVARGTRIRVLFPALEGGQAAASEPWPETPRPLALERDRVILIVDDEDIVRAPCEIYLRRYGFDVLSARNGNEALRIYEQRHREIDCVLLDLTMPGMSGLVVMREMRRIRSDSAIILMSGFSEQAALEDLVSDAPQGFIQKPYRLEELLAVIRRALDENDPS